MASDEQAPVGTSKNLTGTIRWEVDKDSITTKNIFSPEIDVGGMMWNLYVRKNTIGFGQLAVYLNLNDGDYELESVDVTRKFSLINFDDESETITQQADYSFLKTCWGEGYKSFIKWSDAVDERKGFIKNNKLTLQCEFSISNIRGFRKIHRIDFTNPNEPFHDIALVIGGEKIYVSRQHLSIYSPVFTKMFYEDFAEKNQKEIELKDVNREEFIQLLHVIYPPFKKITDSNFKYLLKLCDYFDIKVVIDQIEKFLIQSTIVSAAAKLMFADRYNLLVLKGHCFDNLKTYKDVKALKKSKESEEFSDAIKVALYEKMIAFTD